MNNDTKHEAQVLEVVAWVDSGAGCLYTQKLLEIMGVTSDGYVPLVRLSDATAVIDQLREELAAIKSAPVVMPEEDGRRTYDDRDEGYQIGWNACLDEVARLNRSKT